MTKTLLYAVLILLALCTLSDARDHRIHRKRHRKSRLLGRRGTRHGRRRSLCDRKNCFIRKQQNALQSMMSDLLFKNLVMAPPIDLTDERHKKEESALEHKISKYTAFIQGDVGRLRRRSLMHQPTDKPRRRTGGSRAASALLLLLVATTLVIAGCYYFGRQYAKHNLVHLSL